MVEPISGGQSTSENSAHERDRGEPELEPAREQAQPTRIKGTREGLTINLGTGAVPALLSELAEHLDRQGAFFRGGKVALELGERGLTQDDVVRLAELLERHDMVLRTVLTSSEQSKATAEGLGLRVVWSAPAPVARAVSAPLAPVREAPRPPVPDTEGSKGILVDHVVRSGQIVRHSGHVVILGDVNPGASVVAGGNIIVWGRLNGMAHAGSMGDETAVVCALDMSPMQLRIGQLIARPEDTGGEALRVRSGARSRSRLASRAASADSQGHGGRPEIAHVQEDKIVVDTWDRPDRGI